jgi:hypothetical protein
MLASYIREDINLFGLICTWRGNYVIICGEHNSNWKGLRQVILPTGANIVILASNYNPSIVSKEWLYEKGIFTETVKNFVHTPVFALVENENFSLVVDEQRLQLTIRKVTRENLNKTGDITKSFVDTLPETPYKAVGLNYQYTLASARCNLDNVLSVNKERLGTMFSSTYQIGATIVFEFQKFIVNFAVLPSLGKEQQTRISFNFHSDITNVAEIRERLASQTGTLEKADEIIKELSENG